jgi:hypothetical protein
VRPLVAQQAGFVAGGELRRDLSVVVTSFITCPSATHRTRALGGLTAR